MTAGTLQLTVLDELVQQCHQTAREKGFWEGKGARDRGPECIALMHSELSEALEAMRQGNYYDRDGVTEELADTVIRIFDYAGAAGLPLSDILLEKMARNRERPYKHNKAF